VSVFTVSVTLSFHIYCMLSLLFLTEVQLVDVKSSLAWLSPNLKITWTPHNVIALLTARNIKNVMLKELVGIYDKSKYL
jgi:hypothetical protein